MNNSNTLRVVLAGCTALTAATLVATPAMAQEAEADDSGLDIIIVTAQKREQSLQDVPVAVTALGGDALQANRIQNVVDISGLAPGVTVNVTAGGSGIPSFSVRGQLSYGVAAGSDKQTSMYLDGVYISSPRGSIFDLPDVDRIEVLRGPQGTLFGRNATTGAVSINTREPMGEAGVKVRATIGNQDHYRWGVSAETPQFGPFSAYFSYVHEERDGDLKNLADPVVWDRTASRISRVGKVRKSAEYLGSKDVDTYFAALKFESGDFKTVYKYDRTESANTPSGVSLTTLNRNIPLLGDFLGALVDSNGVTTEPTNGKRPKGVHNSWTIPTDQSGQGHNLTTTYVASDSLSFKSIFGYRKSFIFATSPLDGFSALPFTQEALVPYATFIAFSSIGRAPGINSPADAIAAIPSFAANFAPLIGQPYLGVASGAQSRSKQWSAEVQANYQSDRVTATVGGMWFKSKDYVAEHWIKNTTSFSFVPGGVLQQNGIGEYYNKAESIAAFAQAEIHVTPQVDVILGARVTNDKKFGSFTFGNVPATVLTESDDYSDTQFNYLLGVNYKPTDDIMLYAKFSTAYVSGGTSAGIPFEPEKVKSAEAGIKAELLDRKLRTNLTVWWADTKGQQTPSSANTVPDVFEEICSGPSCDFISVFVLTTGNKESWGVEFEAMAAPTDGLTLGGNVGYTHIKVYDVIDAIQNVWEGYNGTSQIPTWTGSVYAQYETQPLFGDAYLSIRTDAIFKDSVEMDSNTGAPIFALAPDAFIQKSYWTVNGRIALRDIDLGGVNAELALWGRNLFDTERYASQLNISNIMLAPSYLQARSYGMDLTIDF